jgi:methylmalonyl-CoA epimerase
MLALSAVVSAGKAAPPVLKTTATTSAGVAELLVTLDLLAAQVAGVEARVDFHGVRGTTEQLAEKGVSEGFVTGHDFSRAAKANRIKGALAPEGSWLRQISEIASSSASWEVVPLHKATATPVESAVLDHLGVAVRSIDASLGLYRALGVFVSGIEEVPHERVRVAMLQTGDSRIELLEATEPESAVGRFLAKRGEGLHHVAMRVPDLAAAVERLKALNVRLVSEAIQIGAGGHRYVFVHPSSANGVLLELVEAAVTGESN